MTKTLKELMKKYLAYTDRPVTPEMVCNHEAGHALMARHLFRGKRRATISGEGGVPHVTLNLEDVENTVDKIAKCQMVAIAGRVAEYLCEGFTPGEVKTLVVEEGKRRHFKHDESNDLAKAMEVCRMAERGGIDFPGYGELVSVTLATMTGLMDRLDGTAKEAMRCLYK